MLLTSAPEDGESALHAKVADFGMAREMQMQSKHQTRTYGTITHMAPGAPSPGVCSWCLWCMTGVAVLAVKANDGRH